MIYNPHKVIKEPSVPTKSIIIKPRHLDFRDGVEVKMKEKRGKKKEKRREKEE
jgi:hypothetical protein